MNWFLILLVVIFLVALGTDGAEAAEAVANTVTAAPVTLQDSLVSIIQQVQSGVTAGVTFLQAELPDVIRQLLLWKLTQAGIYAGIFVLVGITGVCLAIRGLLGIHKQQALEAAEDTARKLYDNTSYRDENHKEVQGAYQVAMTNAKANVSITVSRGVGGVVGVIGIIVALSNVFPYILTAVQIWIAPKVWLIEYAASLVK